MISFMYQTILYFFIVRKTNLIHFVQSFQRCSWTKFDLKRVLILVNCCLNICLMCIHEIYHEGHEGHLCKIYLGSGKIMKDWPFCVICRI